MLDDLDLNAIQDENAWELIRRLLNLIEQLSAGFREAQAENQWLRDEINRLKGEHSATGSRLPTYLLVTAFQPLLAVSIYEV